jgi:hypothetical protein
MIVHMFGASPQEREVMALERRMAELCGVLNATTAELVRAIAGALETDAWMGVGIRSPEQWVSWRCGVGLGRARRLVAMARRSTELPETQAAFAAGELSEDQVAVVARYVPAPNEAAVAELARHATVAQLSRTLGSYAFAEEPGAEEGPEPTREVSFAHRDDGRWGQRAVLDPEEGALVERGLLAARDECFAARGEDGAEVSWADAFVRMAERSLDHGAERALPQRYQVLLHVRADTPAKEAHLHLGPALPASARRELGCDATVRAVVEADGVPLALGRRRRSVPDRLRLLIEERDRGCRPVLCRR